MPLLAIDIGSSSVKSALLRGTKVLGRIHRVSYATRMDGVRVEVEPREILRAVASAIGEATKQEKSVDALAFSCMGPAWVALDEKHRALTPIVTHQDRRSVKQAHEIERRVGKARHLKLAGNRPVPGGISSTTCLWFMQNERSLMRRATTLAHLNTYLLMRLCGARVTDSSSASFTGLYETIKLAGWSGALCDAIGVLPSQLPELRGGEEVAGQVTARASGEFHLARGLPVLVGVMDGSAAMLISGSKPGQLLNVTGSTDVLALCVDEPKPHPELLTRALGVDRKWVAVSTMAAVGSALSWMHSNFFGDLDWPAFQKLIRQTSRHLETKGVVFRAGLAGSRTSIDQPTAAFENLTLAVTRVNMLAAVLESIATEGAARLELLSQVRSSMNRQVVISGGIHEGIDSILYRDWPKRFKFKREEDASLRGLATLMG